MKQVANKLSNFKKRFDMIVIGLLESDLMITSFLSGTSNYVLNKSNVITMIIKQMTF